MTPAIRVGLPRGVPPAFEAYRVLVGVSLGWIVATQWESRVLFAWLSRPELPVAGTRLALLLMLVAVAALTLGLAPRTAGLTVWSLSLALNLAFPRVSVLEDAAVALGGLALACLPRGGDAARRSAAPAGFFMLAGLLDAALAFGAAPGRELLWAAAGGWVSCAILPHGLLRGGTALLQLGAVGVGIGAGELAPTLLVSSCSLVFLLWPRESAPMPVRVSTADAALWALACLSAVELCALAHHCEPRAGKTLSGLSHVMSCAPRGDVRVDFGRSAAPYAGLGPLAATAPRVRRFVVSRASDRDRNPRRQALAQFAGWACDTGAMRVSVTVASSELTERFEQSCGSRRRQQAQAMGR